MSPGEEGGGEVLVVVEEEEEEEGEEGAAGSSGGDADGAAGSASAKSAKRKAQGANVEGDAAGASSSADPRPREEDSIAKKARLDGNSVAEGRGGDGGGGVRELSKCVLKLRGLPWSATKDDIRAFFEGFKLAGEGEDKPQEGTEVGGEGEGEEESAGDAKGPIRIVFNREGKPSGEAFVLFASQEEARRALSKNKERIGGRWIDLHRSSVMEMEGRTGRGAMRQDYGSNPSASGDPDASKPSRQISDGPILRLRGLPFTSTKKDIMDFFDGFELEDSSIFFVSRSDGRPSGEAFVIFSSPEDAQRAMDLDKKRLGDRWIDLFSSTMDQVHQRVGPAVLLATRPDAKLRNVVRVRGLPFGVEPAEVAHFFEPYGVADFGVYLLNGNDGRPTGEAYVQLRTEEDAARAVEERNKQKVGNRWVELFVVSRSDLYTATMRPIDRPRYGAAASSVPNCCKMRGLPFSVTENDIFGFFSGLSVIGIFICKDHSGTMRPTGEGYVEFSNVEDCHRALTRNRERMSDRYVEVYPCTKEDVLGEINSGGRGGPMGRGERGGGRPMYAGGSGGHSGMHQHPHHHHHHHHHGGGGFFADRGVSGGGGGGGYRRGGGDFRPPNQSFPGADSSNPWASGPAGYHLMYSPQGPPPHQQRQHHHYQQGGRGGGYGY